MEKSCVAIGTFDGVHRGHQGLIEELLRISKRKKLKSVVVALSKPVRHVSGLLTELSEKKELLSETGVEEVFILTVGKKLVDMSARDFFENVIIGVLNCRHLVVGKNFAFGHGRKGDISWLKKNCPVHKVGLTVKSFRCSHGKAVSSSRIRDLLHRGRLEFASALLNRLYSFDGEHVKGRGTGTKLGVPTINLKVSKKKLLPAGVFFAAVKAEGKIYPALVNIGSRPTFFKHGDIVPEVNLLGFHGRFKSLKLRVYLLKHLRKERRFVSINGLKKQINKDLKRARRYFGFTF